LQEGLTYDFIINKKRIQEKVTSSKHGKYSYKITIQRSRGKENNKRLFTPYNLNDFDILWIHIDDKDLFYLIPMKILIEQQLVQTDTNEGKKLFIININNKNTWYSDYEFLNNNINMDKFNTILS
jgi:hypothetical protein